MYNTSCRTLPFLLISSFVTLPPSLSVSLHSRTAERSGWQNSRVWQTWQGYYLRVLSWSSLNVMFSGLIWRKGLFKQNYCHAYHTRSTALFSFTILLRKFTVVVTHHIEPINGLRASTPVELPASHDITCRNKRLHYGWFLLTRFWLRTLTHVNFNHVKKRRQDIKCWD